MALTVGTLWASGWLVHRIGWPLRCGRLRSASALPAFVACGELVGLAQGERNEVEWKALGGSNGSDGRNAVGVWLAGPSDRLASAVRSPAICIRSPGLRRLRGTGRISPGRAERSGVESPRRVEWL